MEIDGDTKNDSEPNIDPNTTTDDVPAKADNTSMNGSIKRGTKRKSNSANETSHRNKIPRFENVEVKLGPKTIVLAGNAANYVLNRSQLTNILPKEGAFEVGDLVWSKLQGFPYWPGLITVDPETGKYSKVSGNSF